MTWPANCWVCSLYWRQKSMMFTPCCPRAVPTGGAGVACPALICNLTRARTFLRVRRALSPMALHLRHLVESELDRGLSIEDAHQHLQLALVHVDLADLAVEIREGPGDDADHVAFLELEPEARGLGLLLLLDREDLLDLAARQRRGLGARSGGDEAGHAGRVPHDVPRVVVVDHLHQQVAGEDLPLDDLLLASLDLHDVFHGDDHVEDLVLHLHGVDPGVQVGLDLVLVSRVRVDHVPLPRPLEGTAPHVNRDRSSLYLFLGRGLRWLWNGPG